MATVKNKIRRLQRLQHRLRCEESIRQFENRSKEELLFFALNGHFKVRNDNQRVVKPEEIRAFEKSLYALARAAEPWLSSSTMPSTAHGRSVNKAWQK